MKRFSQSFLGLGLLLSLAVNPAVFGACCNNTTSCSTSSTTSSCNTDCDDCTTCGSVLYGRSTHDNVAIFYGNPYEHLDLDCEWNFGTWAAYEFRQTFDDCKLGSLLFGSNTLVLQGSNVTGTARTTGALIADNFGLSENFSGSITFNPQIRSHNLHWSGFLGFDRWCGGLYLRTDLTFEHQERTLCSSDCDSGCGNGNNCTTNCNTSCSVATLNSLTSTTAGNFCTVATASTSANTDFPVGYMADAAATVPAATSVQQALSGTFLFGDMQTAWKWGQFVNCTQTTNELSGFSFDLGYDFWRCEDSHLGIFLRYSAPTGSKLDGSETGASNVFFPVAGNGHHNELGGGLSAWKEFWSDECNSFAIYLDGYATHLFDDCQIRTFDFLNKGCLSRYMLLKQMRTLTPAEVANATVGTIGYFEGIAGTPPAPLAGVSSGGNVNSAFAYNGSLISGVNFTTRQVTSSFDVQGDAAIRLVWERGGFRGSIGYEIWGRSREKLCVNPGPVCSGFDPSFQYAFKGCTGVYYYMYTVGADSTTVTAPAAAIVASNATASNATITSCGTTDNAVPVTLASTVETAGFIGVDYSNALQASPNNVQASAVTNGTSTTVLVATSVSDLSTGGAVVIAQDSTALDVERGRVSSSIANKGFLSLEYVWEDCDWSPFIELGGEVEGGSSNCDINAWGVWFKVGFSL